MRTTEPGGEPLSNLINSLPGVFYVIDKHGRFRHWNRNFEEVSGYSAEEIAGMDSLDFFRGDDKLLIAQRMEEVFRRGMSDAEACFVSKDGTSTPYYFTGTRTDWHGDTCLVGMGIDISARARAEGALRESEEQFRSLFENSPMAIWEEDFSGVRELLDGLGLVGKDEAVVRAYLQDHPDTIREAVARVKILRVNRQCLALHRAPDEATLLTGLEQLVVDESREALVSQLVAVAAGPLAVVCETKVRTLDGEVRDVRLRMSAVPGHEQSVDRVIVSTADITEQRRMEERLRQAQKMEAIGQLAGGVAHDFNNILAAMIMQIDMIKMDGGISTDVVAKLDSLRASADRAADLTRQLLLFGRRQVMQPREVDLNGVVTHMVAMLQRIIGADVRLQVRMHQAPLVTHADPGMIEQVLLNLAVNARDAMPGGGDLVIETSVDTASGARAALPPEAVKGRWVCLRVSDTGHGIAPEHLPHIFEPFFTTKETGKGTGLGLATAFGIVRQHSGWLTVESKPGRGTTFRAWLPASAATAVVEIPPPVRPEPARGNETVLLAEDEPKLRRLTRMILERHGYRVLEAGDGVEALRVCAEHDGPIHLLVTDLVMPGGLDGRQLAARLRERIHDLRVVYTSGYGIDAFGPEVVLDRGERFVAKPSPPRDLLAAVRGCLDE